jgi:hypothetical protein
MLLLSSHGSRSKTGVSHLINSLITRLSSPHKDMRLSSHSDAPARATWQADITSRYHKPISQADTHTHTNTHAHTNTHTHTLTQLKQHRQHMWSSR